MVNKEQAENLTMAYIYSYNKAMQEVKNPNFATQVATGICLAIAMTERKQQPSMLEMIFAQAVAKTQEKKGKSDDRAEDAAD